MPPVNSFFFDLSFVLSHMSCLASPIGVSFLFIHSFIHPARVPSSIHGYDIGDTADSEPPHSSCDEQWQ